jgi:DNA-binding NtrC family response regulator
MQVKLLRLLESGTFRRVGSTELRRSDLRVVAATHRDLKAMVAHGRFRQDLYYRLATFPIALPALRQRASDIPLLATALLTRVAPRTGMVLSRAALARLQQHRFPGNVRELRNVIERAALLCDGERLEAAHVERALAFDRPAAPAAEHDLQARLRAHAGSRAALARELGISERTLYRRLRALAG